MLLEEAWLMYPADEWAYGGHTATKAHGAL